jgi:energy-coupling factor transporter ATP-binding protein EcfA2
MKLAGIGIKNFRRIGQIECMIKIDEIVVLVGQNNCGKSTVLDAYELFASGGKEVELSAFHNGDVNCPIEVTGIFTGINDADRDVLGKKWEHDDDVHGSCIKVRWVWTAPGAKGQKQAFNPESKTFEAGGLGGWDSLLQSRIPKPVRIRPTDPVDTTQTKIVTMLKDHVKARLKADSSSTKKALEEIDKLAGTIFEEAKDALDVISAKITEQVSQVFPGTELELVPKSKDALDEKIIGADSYLRIATAGGAATPLMTQGTGLQRALLWSALSVMSDIGNGKKKELKGDEDMPRILLIDEPEAFLHPPTVRNAREALYDFALKNPLWQVIATTHSPVFIDLSKDHTTIIRVDATSDRQRYVSTADVAFDAPQKTRLKMVRACNPFVNEFFFFDDVILVEGPTEHIVVSTLAELAGSSVHVVDCLGKANIPMFAKILNHFQVPYIVIHDSDTPNCKRKNKVVKNAMWTINSEIRNTVGASKVGSQIFVQFPNFEGAFCPEELSSGKVDNVMEILADLDSPHRKEILGAYKLIFAKDHAIMVNTEEAFNKRLQEHVELRDLQADWQWQTDAS